MDLSAVIFGNFADLMIGYWSGLDLNVDRVTLGASGGVRTYAHMDLDVVARHAESFAAVVDATT